MLLSWRWHKYSACNFSSRGPQLGNGRQAVLIFCRETNINWKFDKISENETHLNQSRPITFVHLIDSKCRQLNESDKREKNSKQVRPGREVGNVRMEVPVVVSDEKSRHSRSQIFPAGSPVEIWPEAEHKLDVFADSFDTVNVAKRSEFKDD